MFVCTYPINVYLYIVIKKQLEIMPIQLLYTDTELVKLQRELLFKEVITVEDLAILDEIQKYFNQPK